MIRDIDIEKSPDTQLGITIDGGAGGGGGVFVASVNPNSIAAVVGLQVPNQYWNH